MNFSIYWLIPLQVCFEDPDDEEVFEGVYHSLREMHSGGGKNKVKHDNFWSIKPYFTSMQYIANIERDRWIDR
jgi:hypothetical protein